jgi:Holliday junction resolvase-like predicted endonuclease
VTRYATAEVTRQYIEYLVSVRLITRKGAGYAVARKRVRSFGETLEWYVAEILKREFSAEAVWGVKFKGRKTGGDYDVIAKLDCVLCYVEVKSSPPKQIYDSEIAAFLDRVADLSPEVAIFLMDTELRMKDKIVPMFESELARRKKEGVPVVRVEKELFHIGGRIYIINAKDGIAGNMQNVLSRYFRGSCLTEE